MIYEMQVTECTPHQRAAGHPNVRKRPVISMNAQFKRLKPAALSRQILALTGQLEALAQAKAAPRDYKVNTCSTRTRNGPFQMRQRSSLPGPIDVRQQGPLTFPCQVGVCPNWTRKLIE
jgi:hypothetical protein